ncbi:DUF1415 domain-containing protein [Eionea flava]
MPAPIPPPSALSPEQLTQQWFERIVLGLNLCPFAHKPAREKTIRFIACDATTESELLKKVKQETQYLETTPPSVCETTVIIVTQLLSDFYDYQFFISEAERTLQQNNWHNDFQIASFHPDYCFAHTEPSDASNLTNRSPYPLIHLLREASVTTALKHVDNPEEIPKNNIEKIEGLKKEERDALFFYIRDKKL